MNTSPLRLKLIDWELSARWALRGDARPLAGAAAETAHELLRCVEFRLRGARVALPLAGVDRLIPRLGELVPLASGQAVAGIALVGGEPLLTVDLEDAATDGAPSTLRLEDRPALVLPYEGGRIALAVTGPADLVEAPFEARTVSARGPLAVRGFLGGEVPLLQPESVFTWLRERLGGVS